MFLGALIAGSLAGIAAALTAVLGFGLPLGYGLALWWATGTALTLLPLLAQALRAPFADDHLAA